MKRHLLTVTLAALGYAASPALAGDSRFQSPSENIGCAMSWSRAGAGVRCDIQAHSWHIAKPPGVCPELDYGGGFDVTRRSRRGTVVCAGDTTLGVGKHLRYGHTISHNGIKCISERSGMTCRNRRGHGFFVSRQRYRLF
jgi:Family of unknown function (DUF6636)